MSRAVEVGAAAAKSSQGSEDNLENNCDIDIDGENLLAYLSAVRKQL